MDSDLNTVMSHASDSDFYDTIKTLGGLFMIFVLPSFFFFRSRGQRHVAAAADPVATGELLDRARRLETRIEYLERVLDTEMPGWRTRS